MVGKEIERGREEIKTDFRMELLFSAGVAVTAAISLLTVSRISPFIIHLHIGTWSRPEGGGVKV